MTTPDIRAALERLHEYAVAHPEHDTDELVAAARAALAEPVGEGPSDEELVELACRQDLAYLRSNGRLTSPFLQTEDIREEVIDFARAVLTRWGHPAAPGRAGGG